MSGLMSEWWRSRSYSTRRSVGVGSLMARLSDQAAHQQLEDQAALAGIGDQSARRYLVVDGKKGIKEAGQPAGGEGEDHHGVGPGAAQAPATVAVNDRQPVGGEQLRRTFRHRQIYASLQYPQQRQQIAFRLGQLTHIAYGDAKVACMLLHMALLCRQKTTGCFLS
ncbi:hypothetical protein LV59_01445 [Klebsiella pneumoniae]|nr:hypothetical protein LV59_01445 [Klebsiella pneumoniae]